MLNDYQRQKMVEAVLYILQKAGTIDIYHLTKILYFAEAKHLASWGTRNTIDHFKAIEYGPVPSFIYDAIKGTKYCDVQLNNMFRAAIEYEANDASNYIRAKRNPDTDFLAPADMQDLAASVADNSRLTFDELMEKSHDKVWRHYYHNPNGNEIGNKAMAEVGGATPALELYVTEIDEIGKSLRDGARQSCRRP